MKDKTLLKISFFTALIGLATLIFLGDIINLEESKISSLDKNKIEDNVKVKGVVNYVNILGKIKIVELEDNTGKIEAVVFNKEAYIKKGSIIELEGKLTIREGKLQINAENIKVFS